MLTAMCSYCGCQSLTVIRLLTLQHEQLINKLGEVRRACELEDAKSASREASHLATMIAAHNKLEEEGLFEALKPDLEFAESLAKLRAEHHEIDKLVGRIESGEITAIGELEITLRNNISNEENGLFPASAVTLDGPIWDAIETAQGI